MISADDGESYLYKDFCVLSDKMITKMQEMDTDESFNSQLFILRAMMKLIKRFSVKEILMVRQLQ